MKATSISPEAVEDRSLISTISDLVKARLTMLVLLTTLVGFYVGNQNPLDVALLFHTLMGTLLVAAGAAALNQYIERDHDARMQRTEGRPLPSGHLQAEHALLFGAGCSIAGLIELAIWVNPLTSFLGAITLCSYLFVYTPLKRVTSLNTAIGAIPGAIPPLMGWTAARGTVSSEGWTLFAILFFWQLPHFLAIAWIYRDEYAKAGFVMLPLRDPDGSMTARQALSHTLDLLPVSLSPYIFRIAGPIYCFGALILGVVFIGCAYGFAKTRSIAKARILFFASILYLPLLLGLMVFDKIKR